MKHTNRSRAVAAVSLSAAVFASSACMRDGEVLAEYTGGNITRGQLRMLFSLMGRPADAKLEEQTQVVRELALMNMAAVEAAAAGVDKGGDFSRDMLLEEERALLTSVDFAIRDDADSHKFDMIEMQALQLAAADLSARRAEAEDVLKNLNDSRHGDADIEKIIALKTENPRYKLLGGYLDPHCLSCVPNPLAHLTEAVDKAPSRKFVLVEASGGYWLVRKLAVRKVKGADLRGVFEDYHRKVMKIARAQLAAVPEAERGKIPKDLIMDEKQIEELSAWQGREQERREMGGLLARRLEEEKKLRKFVLHPAAQPGKKPDAKDYKDATVLFSLGGKDFTFGDLNQRLAAFPEAQLAVKFEALNALIIPYEIMKDTAEGKQSKEHKVYAFVRGLRRAQVLRALLFAKVRGSDEVTEAEIAQVYSVRRQHDFKDRDLASVRNQISQQIKMERIQRKTQEMNKMLTDKYGFKLFTDKLKPGKL